MMIVAASMTLLAESRGARRRIPAVPMLVVGSVASQGANVSAAEQMTTGRIVAAWPSFALIGGLMSC